MPPAPGPVAPPAASKARAAAERAAFGAYLSACLGDFMQAALAVLQGVADEANAAQEQAPDGQGQADQPGEAGGDGREEAPGTGAGSGAVGGGGAGGAAPAPAVAVVLCGDGEAVMQCPPGLVLPLVRRASQQLEERLPQLLGFHELAAAGAAAGRQVHGQPPQQGGRQQGTGDGGSGGAGDGAGGAGPSFPARWWWGPTLDDVTCTWYFV